MNTKFKDLIFDIDTGEFKQIAPKPKKQQEDSSISDYLKYSGVPVFGMGVTREYLNENCLKPGDRCPRFKAVSLSDGKFQAVMCREGPYRKCEKVSERRRY